jgi:hypothetical protein
MGCRHLPSEIPEEACEIVADFYPIQCAGYLSTVMRVVVWDMKDSLPDNTLLLLSLEVLELEGLLKVFGGYLLDKGNKEGVDLFHKGRELCEVIPDLGF